MASHRYRNLASLLFRALLLLLTLSLVVASLLIVVVILVKGIGVLNLTFLTHTALNTSELTGGGGALHAIVGTLEQGLMALTISTPLAISVAVFIDQHSERRMSKYLLLSVNAISTLPTIVISILVSEVFMGILHLSFSGMLGAIALSIIMFPILTAGIHDHISQLNKAYYVNAASFGLRPYQIYLRVILPLVRLGIVDYMLLAFSRGVGETAPIRILIFGNPALNLNIFHGPQSSLTSYIFDSASSPYDNIVSRAWGGSVLLVVIMLIIVFITQILVKRVLCKNV